MESPQQPDWLDESSVEASRAQNEQVALEFSRLYLVFENHPVAKQLLNHWVETIEMIDIHASAPHPVYAYYEGRRAFIRGIRRQIALAKKVPTT